MHTGRSHTSPPWPSESRSAGKSGGEKQELPSKTHRLHYQIPISPGPRALSPSQRVQIQAESAVEGLGSSARNKDILFSVGVSCECPHFPTAIDSFGVAVALSAAKEKAFGLPRHVVRESTTRRGK